MSKICQFTEFANYILKRPEFLGCLPSTCISTSNEEESDWCWLVDPTCCMTACHINSNDGRRRFVGTPVVWAAVCSSNFYRQILPRHSDSKAQCEMQSGILASHLGSPWCGFSLRHSCFSLQLSHSEIIVSSVSHLLRSFIHCQEHHRKKLKTDCS